MPSHERFEIDLVRALSEQLESALNQLCPASLTEVELQTLNSEQGVYQLFHRGAPVYVGKADNLPSRLSQHRRKVMGRRNISIEDMGFRCLYVHKNWTTIAPEESLIKRFGPRGECEWNGSSFGPHDPGRPRETTNKAPDGFDAQYPIRDDWTCDWIPAGTYKARSLLILLKDQLPYLLRYETSMKADGKPEHYKKGHPDYNEVDVPVPRDAMTARELLCTVVEQLVGWQATVFPSHMILYKEKREYRHGTVICAG